MRRRQRAFFEDPVSPREIGPGEEVLARTAALAQATNPRVEPFPAVFCLMLMVLSSLLIYGAAYRVLAALN